ncbi:hypothetical protein IRB23SM22_02630 [Alkalibacterium sp. s-m-22]
MIVNEKNANKVTKVGNIPLDWSLVELDEVAEVIDGDRSSRYPNQDDIVKQGVLFLSTKNINGSYFSFNERRFITEEKYKTITKGKLRKNDLVITMRGSIGKVALFKSVEFDRALINAQMSIIRPEKINSKYLWMALNSIIMPRHLRIITSGSAQPQLTKKDVKKIPIIVPSEREQSEIVNILSTWDKAIELKQQLIDLKKEQKIGLMQKLLTEKNFMIEHQSYSKKLGDICNISTGDKNNQDKIKDGEYPFFVRSENIEKINTYSYNGEAILIPGDGRIGQIFHYINGKFDFHQRVYKISDFSGNVSGKYIYYYLNKFFLKHALKFSAKATVDSLRRPMLTDFCIELPSLEKQNKIVEILDVVQKQIDLQNIELNVLKEQKKGLMQQLLTGKTRVKV